MSEMPEVTLTKVPLIGGGSADGTTLKLAILRPGRRIQFPQRDNPRLRDEYELFKDPRDDQWKAEFVGTIGRSWP